MKVTATIIKIRVILWSILAATTFWLAWQAVVPFGHITYTSYLSGDSYFIRKLTPAERVVVSDDQPTRITGDPVYFSLRAPRRFDRAVVVITYRRGGVPSVPIIEAGVLADKTIWRYDLKPVENRTIDQLSQAWEVMREGNTVLLQKEKKFNSISEFLIGLPPREEIAAYNYNLKSELVIADYAMSAKNNTLTQSLRGPYQFYTYLGGEEEVDYSFSFVDLNQNRDSDPVDVNLYYQGSFIDSHRLDDDGNAADNNKPSDRRELDLKLVGLPAGVYKVEVRANDDIITKQIAAKQQKMAFINKINLAGGNSEDITLYTDGTQLHVLTDDPAKLQAIKVNGVSLELEETYKQYDLVLPGTTTAIVLAEDGVTLAGDGVFSFSREALINADFKKVSGSLDVMAAGIKYVIADYLPPSDTDGWRTAKAAFDLSAAYRENGAYSFLISIPGLKAEDGAGEYIEVKEIMIELQGKTLWEKINEKISNY
ncbi:MAG: hypothetical protein MUC28_01970 [Planctomycetes bacterium]|nr:hypothetical protein [Planctomycetota bacterium]